MKTIQKSSAIFLVIIGVLLLALFTAFLDHNQELSRANNNHALSLAEYNRSLDQEKKINKNLVQMLNIFTSGHPVLVTAYNAHESQTDDSPTVTASNETVKVGGIALSRDFLKIFDSENSVAYGDTILLITPMEVNDTMNSRYINRADVFMWDYKDAVRYGIKEGLIYK